MTALGLDQDFVFGGCGGAIPQLFTPAKRFPLPVHKVRKVK